MNHRKNHLRVNPLERQAWSSVARPLLMCHLRFHPKLRQCLPRSCNRSTFQQTSLYSCLSTFLRLNHRLSKNLHHSLVGLRDHKPWKPLHHKVWHHKPWKPLHHKVLQPHNHSISKRNRLYHRSFLQMIRLRAPVVVQQALPVRLLRMVQVPLQVIHQPALLQIRQLDLLALLLRILLVPLLRILQLETQASHQVNRLLEVSTPVALQLPVPQ